MFQNNISLRFALWPNWIQNFAPALTSTVQLSSFPNQSKEEDAAEERKCGRMLSPSRYTRVSGPPPANGFSVGSGLHHHELDDAVWRFHSIGDSRAVAVIVKSGSTATCHRCAEVLPAATLPAVAIYRIASQPASQAGRCSSHPGRWSRKCGFHEHVRSVGLQRTVKLRPATDTAPKNRSSGASQGCVCVCMCEWGKEIHISSSLL